MKIGKCRICGSRLEKSPLLILKNMPSRAQFLPSKKEIYLDRKTDLKIFQCSFCGVVQLKNRPVEYYRSVIRATGISEEMKNFRINQFTQFVKRFSLEQKKVIEIGCGRGEFLSILSKICPQACGIEYDKNLVKECRKAGLNVYKDFIEDSSHVLKGSPFDGFVMFSYLEHLPNPCEVLKGIRNNLKDDGVGIVEVPNFDMILREKLLSEFMLDHLFYFTKETLKTVLSISGFDVLECSEIWHDYIISAVIQKKKRLVLSSLLEHQKKISKEIDEYLSKFADKKVAIWGAGHQALSVLCFLKLIKKIKYVVDSAPFKQGRYTPVTHIPIVSPDLLDSDPVEAIIIMAGSYSDEVASIVKQKYKNLNVMILKNFGLKEF